MNPSFKIPIIIILFYILFFWFCKTCTALTYYVTTEQNKLGKVIIEYEPTQYEIDRLEALTERFYQSNKNIKDKYYVYSARNFVCRKLSYDHNYKITGDRAFTPYPLIDSRKTVCMGYSSLMQILLDKKGIINILAYDTRITHIWNRMLVENEWIDIDVTNYDNGG